MSTIGNPDAAPIAHYREGMTLPGLIRKLGVLVVVSLPFQGLIKTLGNGGYLPVDKKYTNLVAYVDESACIFLFFMAITFLLVRPDVYKAKALPFTKWIIGFILFALLSMLVNGVKPLQGILGVYDVIKNIVVIYPFMLLRFDKKDMERLLAYLQCIALVMAVAGLFGEFIALAFNAGFGILTIQEKRYGIYKIISLAGMGNWNYLGVYSVLLFFLSYVREKGFPMRRITLALTASLVVLSFSRQVVAGFVLIFFLLSQKSTRWLSVFVVLFAVAVSTYYYDSVQALVMEGIVLDPEHYFRLYGFTAANEIFLQNPFMGLGPGMFGGLAASLFESPVYDSWPAYFRMLAFNQNGIDQFWPMIWAETGAVGFFLYSMIFAGIFLYLRKVAGLFKAMGETGLSRIGHVLSCYILALAIMGFAGGLNSAFVVFTYFALVGIYISVFNRYNEERPLARQGDCGHGI